METTEQFILVGKNSDKFEKQLDILYRCYEFIQLGCSIRWLDKTEGTTVLVYITVTRVNNTSC